MMSLLFCLIIVSHAITGLNGNAVQPPRVAIAQLTNQRINGSILFTETDAGIRVSGVITGLPVGKYGFHIHDLGDITNCYATGSHFNPDNLNHGGRDHEVRHVGDFGNVEFTSIGTEVPVANVNFVDRLITLRGRNSILGRSVVLHENEDDLGLTDHELSLISGNAGPRIACGVIGIRSPPAPWNSAKSVLPSVILILCGLITFVSIY